MNLSELFQQPGLGVMATAGADGSVNTAVYARPHVIDETTLVWGMTDGRTVRNIARNPHASFLFKAGTPGFSGVRLALELIRTEEEGEMLAHIKENADTLVGPGTGNAVTHAAWFRVVEVRPLI
ncbi:pyridoxamine 5'-phosphate oxidase family protein [Geobacter sulfurreducens]|uniref:pyridoxamine 5'-phosphate oxidase family protein n=1 Tax=Geobacter sulfurreducens TaxID=35554 RepID=UPI000DBAFC22|nr:pyridoxamine 5'-phosphate oxidase family protein [Geobacter sulfurreducens]BBA70766.1 hypothetical protein YM18_2248 [Geobacter sulfurreducens]